MPLRQPTSRVLRVLAAFAVAVASARGVRAETPAAGYHARVAVSAPTRLDWVFPLANQSVRTPPKSWLDGYDSTRQTYELFVPNGVDASKPRPLVLFIAPGGKSAGWKAWSAVCRKRGMLFAAPHGAGNDCPMPRRVRIVMDVLDDVRRSVPVDVDRTYIAGFSGGGRVACAIAFAVPEYFGGVIPVCAAGELREESWLRQRVVDRLSVALVTGESDFNRGEVERFRGPQLSDVGVRTRVWVPKTGHSLPPANVLAEVHDWLEAAAADRATLAKSYPASRITNELVLTREEWAQQLFDEGRSRLKKPETLYSGLMQLKGVSVRWADLAVAKKAKELLVEYDSRARRPWEEEDIAEQRRFLVATARGLSRYASGDLPKQYAKQRSAMAEAALRMWAQVVQDGKDAQAAEEGRRWAVKLLPLVRGTGGKPDK